MYYYPTVLRKRAKVIFPVNWYRLQTAADDQKDCTFSSSSSFNNKNKVVFLTPNFASHNPPKEKPYVVAISKSARGVSLGFVFHFSSLVAFAGKEKKVGFWYQSVRPQADLKNTLIHSFVRERDSFNNKNTPLFPLKFTPILTIYFIPHELRDRLEIRDKNSFFLCLSRRRQH